MTITDHGIPVSLSRQFTTALSRNAANTGWNYIVGVFDGGAGAPVEWPVISDLTGTPSTSIYDGPTHLYPSLLYQYTNQLRAANGRIFFPLFGPATAYYDPTDEQVHQIAQITETPPQNPNASTTFYSAIFDVDGLLYMGTQESADRQCMIVVTDPTSLVQTILGYVGDSATGFTTYAHKLAPDTHTATKWIYVVYGEAPWQLWALNILTNVATKLYEVPATGNIQFVDISGKGWTAIIDTNLGQPSNVRTQWWCIDGAIYAYAGGNAPGTGNRNVTPQSNPLSGSPPQLDITGGAGVIGWRAGSSGPYTYVNYSVVYTLPVAIESLIASTPNNGIVGNATQYSGFFQFIEPADTHVWYGPWASGFNVSQGPRLNISGKIYIAGYPNGVLDIFDPTAPWNSNADVNPHNLGYYGLNGTQFAGIKYADALAWAPLAGVSGRLYCCGERERNGSGAGIGSWDKTSGAFAGTYAATGMPSVLPSGIVTLPIGQSPSLVVLEGISRVVMSTRNISGSGTAPLYVFDYDLNYIGQVSPLSGVPNLGNIYKSSTANVITGIVQGSGNSLGLYQYNVQTSTLVTYTELGITGTLGASCQQFGGTVWIMSGNNLVAVDINALTANIIADFSSIMPVAVMAFASDGHTLFAAAGSPSGQNGAQLYSYDIGSSLAADALVGVGTLFDATFVIEGNVALEADPLTGSGSIATAFFDVGRAPSPSGDNVTLLGSNEAGTITRGQPVYSDGNGTVRLACADGTNASRVSGIVAVASIALGNIDNIALSGVVVATPAEWDAIAGTTGGLAHDTIYYLSSIIPGRLTSTPPSSGEIVKVLRGIMPTHAKMIIEPPVTI